MNDLAIERTKKEISEKDITTSKEKIIGTALTLVSASAFGLMAIFVKWAYAAGMNLLTMLSLRFFIAAVVLWLVVFCLRQSPRVTWRQFFALAGLGVVGYGLQSTFYFKSVNLIPASITAILLYTYPLLVTLLSSRVNKEPVTKYKAISLAVSLAGLVMVVGVAFTGLSLPGLVYGEMAAIVYSLYIIISGRLLQGIKPLIITTYVMSSAALTFNLIGWTTGSVKLAITPQGWWALAGIALVSTIVAILTFFQAMEILGPSKVSIISTFEPLVTTISAFVFFAETLTLIQITGGILIIAAVILIQKDNE